MFSVRYITFVCLAAAALVALCGCGDGIDVNVRHPDTQEIHVEHHHTIEFGKHPKTRD